VSAKDRIAGDLKEAMRAKDKVRIDALRAALSAFSYRRIEAGAEPSEADQLDVLRKQVKLRNDSIAEFQKAGRQELVDKETRERDILQQYLPAQKSPDEIRAAVRDTLASLPPESRNAGGAMKALMTSLRGQADGTLVRTILGEELARAE
jgi:uncharacterized protein YqeY